MDVGVGVCSLWLVGYIQALQKVRPVLVKVQFQQDLCSPLFPTIPRNVPFKRKILVIGSSEGRENHQSWDVIWGGRGWDLLCRMYGVSQPVDLALETLSNSVVGSFSGDTCFYKCRELNSHFRATIITGLCKAVLIIKFF